MGMDTMTMLARKALYAFPWLITTMPGGWEGVVARGWVHVHACQLEVWLRGPGAGSTGLHITAGAAANRISSRAAASVATILRGTPAAYVAHQPDPAPAAARPTHSMLSLVLSWCSPASQGSQGGVGVRAGSAQVDQQTIVAGGGCCCTAAPQAMDGPGRTTGRVARLLHPLAICRACWPGMHYCLLVGIAIHEIRRF